MARQTSSSFSTSWRSKRSQADLVMPAEVKELGGAQWRELYYLSHADTRRAYAIEGRNHLCSKGARTNPAARVVAVGSRSYPMPPVNVRASALSRSSSSF